MRKLTIIAALSCTACVDYKPPQVQTPPVETKTPTLLKFEASPLTVVARWRVRSLRLEFAR